MFSYVHAQTPLISINCNRFNEVGTAADVDVDRQRSHRALALSAHASAALVTRERLGESAFPVHVAATSQAERYAQTYRRRVGG